MATHSPPSTNTAGMRAVASASKNVRRPRNPATRPRRATYAHRTTTRRRLPSCPWRVPSPSVSTFVRDETVWNGHEYAGRHGETAMRAAENIIRSRIARASHGKPTVEPLERTALRPLKRAGRPRTERTPRAHPQASCRRTRQRPKNLRGLERPAPTIMERGKPL